MTTRTTTSTNERTRASWLVYALGALCAGAIVAAVLVVGPASGSQASVTRTATVARGVVQSTVSGSGNLQPASQLNLGFKTSGTVTQILVSQGEHVTQGQLLATLDPQSAEVTLEQAKAALQSAEADLAKEEESDGESSTAQGSGGSSAGNAASASAAALVGADGSATARDAAIAVSDRADGAIGAPAEEPAGSTTPDASPQAPQAATTPTPPTATTEPATTTTTTTTGPAPSAKTSPATSTPTTSAPDTTSAPSSATGNAPASSSPSERAASKRAPETTETTTGSSTSKTTLSPATREANLASARAAVRSAALTVQGDEQAVQNTKLYAPESGTIASLSGQVGEVVSGGGTTRASASASSATGSGSGATAAGAGAAGATRAGAGSSSSSAASSSTSSSSAFAVLSDLSSMQLVAPLSESEVGHVRDGQIATVTVEALEGRKLAAHVSEVAILSTSNSGVVSYDVTFQLDQMAAGLKPGMSATAEVVVQQAEGINVPTSAISAGNVTVVRGGKQVRQAVLSGLAGDSSTIILSGLKAGETIVLPVASTSGSGGAASLTSRSAGRFGGGGLGGGGLGGGIGAGGGGGGAALFRGGG